MSILEFLLLLTLAGVSAGGAAALFATLLGMLERGIGVGNRIPQPAPVPSMRRHR
jgi:hypothetical protein